MAIGSRKQVNTQHLGAQRVINRVNRSTSGINSKVVDILKYTSKQPQAQKTNLKYNLQQGFGEGDDLEYYYSNRIHSKNSKEEKTLDDENSQGNCTIYSKFISEKFGKTSNIIHIGSIYYFFTNDGSLHSIEDGKIKQEKLKIDTARLIKIIAIKNSIDEDVIIIKSYLNEFIYIYNVASKELLHKLNIDTDISYEGDNITINQNMYSLLSKQYN